MSLPEDSAVQAKEWWTPIPPLARPDGRRDAEYNALSGIGNGLVITNAAEMPEAQVQWSSLAESSRAPGRSRQHLVRLY